MQQIENHKELTVLISCMNQENCDIIKRTNVQTDVVVVNQCNHDCLEEFDFTNKWGRVCHVKYICTTERGLSRSRNMAIKYADGDVCLICDDDEVLVDNYEEIILSKYKIYPSAIAISFKLIRDKNYSNKTGKLGFIQILRTSSVEITFNLGLIKYHGIHFDEKMGSGTGNGAGEEIMFLTSCRKTRSPMFFCPEIIAELNDLGESQWFRGYDKNYFRTHAWTIRRIMGSVVSILYLGYALIAHRSMYSKDIGLFDAIRSMIKGYFEHR